MKKIIPSSTVAHGLSDALSAGSFPGTYFGGVISKDRLVVVKLDATNRGILSVPHAVLEVRLESREQQDVCRFSRKLCTAFSTWQANEIHLRVSPTASEHMANALAYKVETAVQLSASKVSVVLSSAVSLWAIRFRGSLPEPDPSLNRGEARRSSRGQLILRSMHGRTARERFFQTCSMAEGRTRLTSPSAGGVDNERTPSQALPHRHAEGLYRTDRN